jgi:hypothetical protein
LPESFGFSVSRKGTLIAIYGATNIWLINASHLPRLFTRILEVRRKPVALDIMDNGSLLAVLSTPSKVDVYRLPSDEAEAIKKERTILLEYDSKSIALTSDGLVLATGNEFGIEIMSLALNANEANKRYVSSPRMDNLQFSEDGRTLLATTSARRSGISTIFTVHGAFDGPFTEEGIPIQQEVDKAWTTQILFPEKIRIARQASLLPDSSTGQVNELFAFDASEDSWGIFDLAGLTFTEKKAFLLEEQRWTRAEFLDDALPAVSPTADHVAIALRKQNTTSIWIYRLPESSLGGEPPYQTDSEHVEDHSPLEPCACIPVLQGDSGTHQEIAVLRWLTPADNPNLERLIAIGNVTRGIGTTFGGDETLRPMGHGSSGVVVVMDFDRTKTGAADPSVPIRITYDLDGLLPGDKLPEENIEFEREVELVRTRTVAQRRNADRAAARSRNSRTLNRSQTTSSREEAPERRIPPMPTITREEEDDLDGDEAQAAFEAPYDHSQPRSQMSLQRAATVAAVSPANRRHLRALPFRPLDYRRADGMREMPHESDADNWVPPPPPYTPSADPPGPGATSISLSHPVNPQPRTEDVPPVPPVPTHLQPRAQPTQMPVFPPVLPLTGLPTPTSSSRAIPIGPNSMLMVSSSTESASVYAPERRPSLVHPSTYPGPQSPSLRNAETCSPTPHSAGVLFPPFRVPSVRAPARENHYTTRAVVREGHPALPAQYRPSGQQIASLERATSRRGEAPPRMPIAQTRRVASAESISVQRQSTRRPMLPRLSTIQTGAPGTDREPMTAPPRAQSRAQSRLQNVFTTEDEILGRKFPKCVVM